jgi:hypothetical protein
MGGISAVGGIAFLILGVLFFGAIGLNFELNSF